MADYQQVVEQIRAFLQASDQTRNERLEVLAKDFVEACTEVNQRLTRCQRLLQQGLRSEAIQLAASEPRLLDAVTTLDFPERKEWDELVEIYSLGGAPKLLVEARDALNGAYAEAEPLQNVLRIHRRLATQRAPLRTRIGVMRKLAYQDARNPIWTEDLRAFEKARFRQIQVEAAEAVRLHDAAHLARLLTEVQEPAWIEPPPKALAQGLSKADAQLRREQARTAVTDIAARLSDALTAGDPIRGRAARDEWTTMTASVPVADDDPCLERVRPALQWLEEEDRRAIATEAYEADLAALSSALDDRRPMSAAELEGLERQVLRHARGIPEKVQRRYATRFRSASASRTRRFRLIVAAVAVAVVLAGALGIAMFRGSLRSGDAQKAAAEIAAYLDKGDFEGAEDFLEDLEKADPGLLTDPTLVEARHRSKTARSRETERVRKFEDAMQEAQSSALDDIESKPLATARSLARLESEKQAVEKLTQQREAARKEASGKRESRLRPQLNGIIQKLDQLADRLAATPRDEPRFQDELDSSRRTFHELAPDAASAGGVLEILAGVAKQKLDAVSDRFDQLHRQWLLEDEMTSAVAFSNAENSHRLGVFASRLADFVKAYPTDRCSAAFQQTLKERPLWEAVEAWNGLATRWNKPHDALRPQEAGLRAKDCGEFLAKYPGFAGKQEVEEYRRYLQTIARRGSGKESPAATLQNVFSNPLIENIWMILVGGGPGEQFAQRFYTRAKPVERDKSLLFVSIFAKEDRKTQQSIPLDRITSRDLSPQSKIAAQFKPRFSDRAKLDRWESNAIELVGTILSDRDIDPFLQVLLLMSVVKATSDGSEPIRVSLESMSKQLANAGLNLDVDWTNPRAPHLGENQSKALELIEALRKEPPDVTKVRSIRDRLERTVRQTYRTIGWVVEDREGYKVRTGVALPADADVSVIAPAAAKSSEWKKVGAITGGKVKLDTSARSALVEGRPVFASVTNY